MPGARQAVARLAFGSLGVCESRTEHEGWRESVVVIQKLKHCSNGLYLVPGRAGWLAIVDLGIFGRSSGRHSVALESRGVQDAEGVGAGAGSLSDDVEVAQPPPGVFGDGVAAATAGPGVCALSPLHCAGHPPYPCCARPLALCFNHKPARPLSSQPPSSDTPPCSHPRRGPKPPFELVGLHFQPSLSPSLPLALSTDSLDCRDSRPLLLLCPAVSRTPPHTSPPPFNTRSYYY